jgi:putative ABC transport system permease protein
MRSTARRIWVSAAFVRHHWRAYTGAAALLGAATAAVTAEMVLYVGLTGGDAVEWDNFSVFDQRVLRASIQAFRGILQVMTFTTVAIAIVLVFLGLRNMLGLRRWEFGQLRLVGASVLRIRTMIVLEALVLAIAVVIPSALVGWLLAHPFYLLLQSVGVFGQALHVNFGFPGLTILSVAAGMIACTCLAAWLGFRPRHTANLLDALEAAPSGKPAARLSMLRVLVSVASVAGLAVFLIVMPDSGNENPIAFLIVPLLIVFPLAALAPILVPVAARALAGLLRPITRGPGVLVAQRAHRDARRFASNVLPLLILVGVLGGFQIGVGADQSAMRADYETLVAADLVAQPATTGQADLLAARASNDPRVGSVMRSASTTRLIEVGRPDGAFLTVFNFVDLSSYADMFATQLTSGSLDGLGGTRIVSTRDTDRVGDAIFVEAPNGNTVKLEVAAIITSQIDTGLLVDWATMSQLEPVVWNIRVFLTTSPGQTAAIAYELSAVAPMLTKEQFVQSRIEARQSNANAGNVALFGTVYFLSLVAMIQGAAASVADRKPEYRLLSLLGVSRPRILTTLLVEVLVLVATSAVLLTAALAFISWRYLSDATQALSIAIEAIPWASVALTFTGMSALLVITVLVTGLRTTAGLEPRSASHR